MKTINTLLFLVCITLATSCSKDSEDEFKETNGNDVKKKYLTSIKVIDDSNLDEGINTTFSYDADGKLNTVSDEDGSVVFKYSTSGKLETITGNNTDDNISISEFYQAPYNAFEIGQVTEYDKNGNPTKIRVYDGEDNGESIFYDGEITYDSNPNFFFYTLEAGGILEVLDRVDLNFSLVPTNQALTKAKALIPYNNPTSMIFKDASTGTVSFTSQVKYTYDEDKYPILAKTVIVNSDEISNATVNYSYK
ncbi:hypothetical protein [Galbibacter orientalis]|uniref:hypothetical protein n=1 Tax=Galbibacter orientalis TaxID=453852 RepID=UPI0030804867